MSLISKIKTSKVEAPETKTSDVQASEMKVSHSCDARACCPGNVLEAKKGFHFVKIGEILEIIADDEDVKYYMPIWAENIGHELIKIFDCGHCYKIWIRKLK